MPSPREVLAAFFGDNPFGVLEREGIALPPVPEMAVNQSYPFTLRGLPFNYVKLSNTVIEIHHFIKPGHMFVLRAEALLE